MTAMAGQGGMLPEQIWDSDDIPARGLSRGRATGSAMPLAWAHAEYIKLACSIAEGRPVDRPDPLWARYRGKRPEAGTWFWSPQAPLRSMPRGLHPGVCLPVAATVIWRFDDGPERRLDTRELVAGAHVARLPVTGRRVRSISFRLQGYGEPGSLYRIQVAAGNDRGRT
jgi:glucoamylase